MLREARQALIASAITFLLCAVTYPAVVWVVAQLGFPRQAEGSLVYRRDRSIIGSELIAQPFAQVKYFQPRPSAAGPNGYAADAASGSNLGPKNPALRQRIALDVARQLVRRGNDRLKDLLDRLDARQTELKARNDLAEKTGADEDTIAALSKQVEVVQAEILAALEGIRPGPNSAVPIDLVTASGGGLDPHISPEAASYQAARVAAARGLAVGKVRDLIDRHIERSGAFLGAPPRVNVLLLNLALDNERASD